MKKWSKPISGVFLFLLLLSALALPALAAPFRLQLPVTVRLDGPKPGKVENFRIQLKAISPDAPMPEDASGGVYILELAGAGTGSFPELTFDHPVQVQYRISQIPGDARYYHYDPSVYTLDLLITNTPQGLVPQVILSKEGQKEKAGELLFENSYSPPAPPAASDSPKLGDAFPMTFWVTTGTASLLGAILLSLVSFPPKKKK